MKNLGYYNGKYDEDENVVPNFENLVAFASGTFSPHITAKSCTTISHAPELKSSCFEGNFAIQREPSGDITEAFVLAPPR